MKKYLFVLLILVIILPACKSGKPSTSDASASSEHPITSPTPTPIIAKETMGGYKEVDAPRVIIQSELPTTYKELANHPIGQNGKIVFYQAEGDMVRYAYKTENAFYSIGDIGAGHYYASIVVLETKIFGKSLIRVKGDCGANCRMTDYLQVDDGGISSLLFFGGDAVHIDVDQDGELEILSRLSSTIPTIHIVKSVGQKLMELNVNEALKTEKGVVYDNEKQIFSTGASDQIESYRLDPKGIFILEPTP